MAHEVPQQLATRINARVLAYVATKSAHDDVSSLLSDAVRPLGDVQTFCPDPAAYRYVVVSTRGIVFGFAVGMGTIAFRLDQRMKDRAIATGAVPCPECGDDWVVVTPDRPDSDWPAVDLTFWARKAYVNAREG